MKYIKNGSRSIREALLPSIILLIFMLMSTKSLSQSAWGWERGDNPGNYGAAKNFLHTWSGWSRWQTVSCYSGLDFRVRRDKDKVPGGDSYAWEYQFRNRYSEEIHFSFSATDSRPYSVADGEYSNGGDGYGRTGIRANQTEGTAWGNHLYYTEDENSIYVIVTKVRFGRDGLQEYSKCDNNKKITEEKQQAEEEATKAGAKKEQDDFWSGGSSSNDNTGNRSNDFWSGGSSSNNSTGNRSNDFWSGKGSNEEERHFESQTKPPESNQFIGDIESYGTKYLTVRCIDHGQIDGDRVSVSLNGSIIKSNITLTGDYTSFDIRLRSGQNRIDFTALNEGTASPNTAKFIITDDKGETISDKEWNIKRNYTATLLIITY